MKKSEVVIATISWARNSDEELLLKESLSALSGLQIPVFVTDGGSSESYLQTIKELPNITLLPSVKGLWAQAKNSLNGAAKADTPYVFYTEPDKLAFFQQGLPRMLDEIAVNDQTGIYLASRSAEGFKSFPTFQQMTETTINKCSAEVIGAEVDYVYGPFLLNKKLVPYLDKLQPNIGWGWRPYAFTIAKRLGYTIKSFTGDFYCPEDQRTDNLPERVYRMKQLTQNIEGLTLAVAADVH